MIIKEWMARGLWPAIIRINEKVVREFPCEIRNYLSDYVIAQCTYNWQRQSFDYLCYSHQFCRVADGADIPVYNVHADVEVKLSRWENEY